MASPDPSIEQVVRDLRRDAMAADLTALRGGAGGRGGAAADGRAAAEAREAARAVDERAARRTLAYLERWLQAILTDRRARLYGARA
jgi:hypothetical protein